MIFCTHQGKCMPNMVYSQNFSNSLALLCAKNHLFIFSSFLDIWENVEWPRFFGPPCILKLNQNTEYYIKTVTKTMLKLKRFSMVKMFTRCSLNMQLYE